MMARWAALFSFGEMPLFHDFLFLEFDNQQQVKRSVNKYIFESIMWHYFIPIFIPYYEIDHQFVNLTGLQTPNSEIILPTKNEKNKDVELDEYKTQKNGRNLKNEQFSPNAEKMKKNSQEPEEEKANKKQLLNRWKKDEEFNNRPQSQGRNLRSNTLKIYLKQVRDLNSETFLNISKIIEVHKINYRPEKFIRNLNSAFPIRLSYIRFQKVVKLCNSEGEDSKKSIGSANFGKILRISLSHFFRFQIYAVDIKSVRTTRKTRNTQFKVGLKLLNQLNLKLGH